ncbi:MAG: efflux RND transporter periplasmic adaptor subunit [Geminicoccaceae bacterium]
MALLAGLIAACKRENEYVPPPPPAVRVSQPSARAITDYLEVTGNMQAFNAVDLVARVEGFLEEIKVPDGAQVKKGDVLFTLERPPYEAKQAQAQGDVEQQQALLGQAQTEYARQQRLAKQNATSEADVEKWQAQQGATQAALDQAKASQQMAQINLGYTTITAPFDGRITAHLVDPGALVGAGAPTKLATLVQLDPIYVYFNVDERQVLRIKDALRAQGRSTVDLSRDIAVEVGLQTEEGYPHRGRLDYIAPEVDTNTGTLTVRGVVQNGDQALLPGLFVRVRVPLRTRQNVLSVPDRAVGSDQGGSYVLIVDDKNSVQQRHIQVGALVEGWRVVEDGIGAKDRIIVGGIQRAVPGGQVTPEPASEPVGSESAPAPAVPKP